MSERRDTFGNRVSGEKEVLGAFLDYQRETVLMKAEGLSNEDAGLAHVPSATTIAGIVSHLIWVERWWFEHYFAGRDVEFPWSEEDPDADWRPGEATLGELAAGYRTANADSNEVLAASSLDDLSAKGGDRDPDGRVSLRWLVLHMIEETARHAGHADILRELTDGSVGE